jgi:hypothetical protein
MEREPLERVRRGFVATVFIGSPLVCSDQRGATSERSDGGQEFGDCCGTLAFGGSLTSRRSD